MSSPVDLIVTCHTSKFAGFLSTLIGDVTYCTVYMVIKLFANQIILNFCM